jgi:succinylarginine dihydrolase
MRSILNFLCKKVRQTQFGHGVQVVMARPHKLSRRMAEAKSSNPSMRIQSASTNQANVRGLGAAIEDLSDAVTSAEYNSQNLESVNGYFYLLLTMEAEENVFAARSITPPAPR